MKKQSKKCKYCEAEKTGKPIIVLNYNKKESKILSEHLRHKNN